MPDSRSGVCPRCASPQPHLHPAVQHEGEVQPCPHDFHRQVTPQNTPERIADVERFLTRDTGRALGRERAADTTLPAPVGASGEITPQGQA